MRRLALLATLAVAGLALLAFVASRIGTDALVREIAIVRVGLPIIVVLSFLRLVLQTRSWSIALALDGIRSSTRELICNCPKVNFVYYSNSNSASPNFVGKFHKHEHVDH